MNIVLITYDFFPNTGGVAYTLLNIFKNLNEKGYNFYIFNRFYKDKNIFKIITKVNPSFKALISSFFQRDFYLFTFKSMWALIQDQRTPFIHRIKMILYLLLNLRKLKWTNDNIIRLIPYLKELKFDIILGGNTRWCLPLNFIISRMFKKRIISMAFGSDFLLGRPLSLKSYYYRNLDKIILIGNEMRLLIKKIHKLNDEKLEIIRVGINIEDVKINQSRKELRKEFKIPEDQFIILCVGRHTPRKKFDLVIKAINEIRKSRPAIDLMCYLIGEGQETRNLKKLTKNLKLENNIKFLGFCDFNLRNKFYKLSDLFIMPSISNKNSVEGFGIVFLEANYHKIPVIGTATGGIKDAIVDNETGLLIKPNDLNDLIEKIIYLYDHEEFRKELGENGHRRVVQEYLWDKIIMDYHNLFQSYN